MISFASLQATQPAGQRAWPPENRPTSPPIEPFFQFPCFAPPPRWAPATIAASNESWYGLSGLLLVVRQAGSKKPVWLTFTGLERSYSKKEDFLTDDTHTPQRDFLRKNSLKKSSGRLHFFNPPLRSASNERCLNSLSLALNSDCAMETFLFASSSRRFSRSGSMYSKYQPFAVLSILHLPVRPIYLWCAL